MYILVNEKSQKFYVSPVFFFSNTQAWSSVRMSGWEAVGAVVPEITNLLGLELFSALL